LLLCIYKTKLLLVVVVPLPSINHRLSGLVGRELAPSVEGRGLGYCVAAVMTLLKVGPILLQN